MMCIYSLNRWHKIVSKKTSMNSFGTSSRQGHDSSKFYERKIYDEQKLDESKKEEEEESICIHDRIYNHTSEQMHELPDNSIHLMVTSPPYNVGKEYDQDMTISEYRNMLCRVWQETYRVLVPGGRACINVANLGRKPYIPLSHMITTDMNEIGYKMRGEIIWNKGASAGSSCAWGSWKSPSNPVLRDMHEYILIFSKRAYNRPKKDLVATISRDDFINNTKSVWEFGTESAKRVKHPAPFPVELPSRLIQLYTYANDCILDPFIGSGTTAIAAIRDGRHYVGYDTSKEYVEITRDRINHE